MFDVWIRVLLLAILCCSRVMTGADQDFCHVASCSDEPLLIQCPDWEDMITIHHAHFTTDKNDTFPANPTRTCACPNSSIHRRTPMKHCQQDLRLPVAYRCSGHHQCKFELSAFRAQRCRQAGVVYVTYSCIPKKDVKRFCNMVFTGLEGYFANPGYPNYYPGPIDCTWEISVHSEQRIELTILDIALEAPDMDQLPMRTGDEGTDWVIRDVPGFPGMAISSLWELDFMEEEEILRKDAPKRCYDYVEVKDGENVLLKECGEDVSGLRTIRSDSNFLTIRLHTLQLRPRRGILMWYKAKGCPSLQTPHDGFLIDANDTWAHYICCDNYLFETSYVQNRYFSCLDGNHWNDTMEECIEERELRHRLRIRDRLETTTLLPGRKKVVAEDSPDFLTDIAVPTLVIISLLIINGLIVFFLIRVRKRKKIQDRRHYTGRPLPRSISQELTSLSYSSQDQDTDNYANQERQYSAVAAAYGSVGSGSNGQLKNGHVNGKIHLDSSSVTATPSPVHGGPPQPSTSGIFTFKCTEV